jgi:drug/metabolite transporter (DMT)-like permease
LIAGVVAVSWAAPLIRLAEDVPAIVIAATRLSLAALPMLLIAGWTERERTQRLRRRDLLVLALSGVALAVHFGFWVASLQRTSVLSSVALVTMQPIFVALGAWLFLRERPSRRVLIGIGFGAIGALLIFADDLGDAVSLEGNLFALVGALATGTYLVAGRGARQRMSMPAYTAAVYSVTATLLLAAVVVSGESFRGHGSEAWVYLVLLAVVPQLIGHNALNWALGSVPAAIVAVAILGEPAGAAVLAFILLDETPTLLEVGGATLLLAGVYLALRGPMWRPQRLPVKT